MRLLGLLSCAFLFLLTVSIQIQAFSSSFSIHRCQTDASRRNDMSTRRFLSSSSASYPPDLPPLDPNCRRVFWVRHGQVINPGGPDRKVYYGAQDVSLSPLGQLEAQAAAAYLQQFALTKVFSSPLQRAIYGAQQVLTSQQSASGQESSSLTAIEQVEIVPGFCELDRGSWCGLTQEEIGLDNLARFDACDETATPSGGESYTGLQTRVLQARDELLSQLDPGQQACVVSHLQVTRCIVADALGLPTDQLAQLPIDTASVTCIDYSSEGKPTLHFQSFKPELSPNAAVLAEN